MDIMAIWTLINAPRSKPRCDRNRTTAAHAAAMLIILAAILPACSARPSVGRGGTSSPTIALSVAPGNAINAQAGLIAAIWPDGAIVFAPGDSLAIDSLLVGNLSAADLEPLRSSPQWHQLCQLEPTNDFPPDASHHVLRITCDGRTVTHRYWATTLRTGGPAPRDSLAAISDRLLQLRPAAGGPLANHPELHRAVESSFYRPDPYAD